MNDSICFTAWFMSVSEIDSSSYEGKKEKKRERMQSFFLRFMGKRSRKRWFPVINLGNNLCFYFSHICLAFSSLQTNFKAAAVGPPLSTSWPLLLVQVSTRETSAQPTDACCHITLWEDCSSDHPSFLNDDNRNVDHRQSSPRKPSSSRQANTSRNQTWWVLSQPPHPPYRLPHLPSPWSGKTSVFPRREKRNISMQWWWVWVFFSFSL